MSQLELTPYEVEEITRQMTEGRIATREEILEALEEDRYDHITATFYLLAERCLRDRRGRGRSATARRGRRAPPDLCRARQVVRVGPHDRALRTQHL